MTAFTITIVNATKEIARVSFTVEQFAAAHLLPAAIKADLHVALDEVLSNIIHHAYVDDRVHDIVVRLDIEGDVIEVSIEDDGRPFNPLSLPPPDVSATLHERPVGGLGTHFLRELMTEVEYERVEHRNRLVLRKHLHQ